MNGENVKEKKVELETVVEGKTKKFVIPRSKIFLPVNSNVEKEHKEFIPQEFKFEDHGGLLQKVAMMINMNHPVLLIGETGTGKTSLVRYLASKTNNAFRRVNHDGGTTVDDIKGGVRLDAKGTCWVDGVLADAMRKGYWYFADELNAASAEITFAYHSLLDEDGMLVLSENEGEIIKPHKNFRFFAAMNPAADYVGTKELNRALLSRFVVFKVNFPDPVKEEKILVRRVGIDANIAKKMIKFAVEIRANKAKNQIDFILSTRELIMWAGLFQIYKKYIISAELAILNKVKDGDFESIKDLLSLHFLSLDKASARSKTSKAKTKQVKHAPYRGFSVGDKVKHATRDKIDVVVLLPGMPEYDKVGFSDASEGFFLKDTGWSEIKYWELVK